MTAPVTVLDARTWRKTLVASPAPGHVTTADAALWDAVTAARAQARASTDRARAATRAHTTAAHLLDVASTANPERARQLRDRARTLLGEWL